MILNGKRTPVGAEDVFRNAITEIVEMRRAGGESLIFENISKLCKEKNISIARLEKACGLGNATVRAWRTSTPNAENLKRVADYLGVSIDSLMSKSEC